MSGIRIEKRSYSLDPWRLVTPDGEELAAWRTVTTWEGGEQVVQMPMAYPTKAAAVEALGLLAWAAIMKLQAAS